MRGFSVGALALIMLAATLAPAPPELPREIASMTVRMKLVLIPAGEFLMGSPESDNDAREDERPQHRVRISRSFYLGAHEVSQEQYEKVTGRNPSDFSAVGAGKEWAAGQDTRTHPVENISWNDAVAFCNKLSEMEGLKPYYSDGGATHAGGDGYRLPTEAEWEYACRAGTSTRYQGGDDPETLATVGNGADGTFHAKIPELEAIAATDGFVYTSPVGRFRPNAFGLYDMHGNVYEWCWDRYEDQFYRHSPGTDPQGPPRAPFRVFRGGDWATNPVACRSASRRHSRPDYRFGGTGFRVARGSEFAESSPIRE